MEHENKEQPGLEEIKLEAERYINGVLNRSIKYYERHGIRNNILYNGARITIIVLSLSLPALSVLSQDATTKLLSNLMIVVPIIIAVVAALDGFFHWGDIWRSRKNTELTLRRIKREFWADWLKVSLLSANNRVEKAYNLYRKLVEAVEYVMSSEEEAFWGRRIQQLKQGEKIEDGTKDVA